MSIEFRHRSGRVPDALFPKGEVRIWLGDPSTKKEERRLRAARETLKQVAKRGQYDVLYEITGGDRTWEEVVQLATEYGLTALPEKLRSSGYAPTVAELVPAFLDTVREPKTVRKYTWGLGYLVEYVGDRLRMDQVSGPVLDDLMTAMRKDGAAPNTIAGAKTAWSSFFRWAVDREAEHARTEKRAPSFTVNPAHKAAKVKTGPTQDRVLKREEAGRLLEVAHPAMRPQYGALLYAGLRVGEMHHLRPQDVDLDQMVIRIMPQPDWTPKGWPRVEHSKGDVPIHRRLLLPLLEEYEDEWSADHDRYYFTNPWTGGGWTYPAFRRRFKEDVEAAGMVYGRDAAEGVTPHTLRHTLATWLAQQDVQLLKIARILRNTAEMVANRYAHLVPEDLDDTLNRAI